MDPTGLQQNGQRMLIFHKFMDEIGLIVHYWIFVDIFPTILMTILPNGEDVYTEK